jgi:hypothetical protein
MNKQMTEKQALKVILDLASEKGLFKTLNDSMAAIAAFNTLSEALLKEEEVKKGGAK